MFVLSQKLSTQVYENKRNDLLIHTNFLIKTISSFYCSKKGFILMNEYMDDWEKFIERSLPEKEGF